MLHLSDIFGPEKEKSLRRYEYFPQVLSGISKVSRELHKKGKVHQPGFKISNTSMRPPSESGKIKNVTKLNMLCYLTYIMANISLEYPDITEERIYDYYTLIEDEDPAEEYSDLSACSNVEEAVSELHKIHSNYTHRVLVHFKENFEDKNENALLRCHVYDNERQ